MRAAGVFLSSLSDQNFAFICSSSSQSRSMNAFMSAAFIDSMLVLLLPLELLNGRLFECSR